MVSGVCWSVQGELIPDEVVGRVVDRWAPLKKRGAFRRGLWKGPSSCTS